MDPKAVVWHAQDFSEGVLKPETFTARFKNEELANTFLKTLQTLQTTLDENHQVIIIIIIINCVSMAF